MKAKHQVYVWLYNSKALVAIASNEAEARSLIREMYEEDIVPYSPKRLERALQRNPTIEAINPRQVVAFEASHAKAFNAAWKG